MAAIPYNNFNPQTPDFGAQIYNNSSPTSWANSNSTAGIIKPPQMGTAPSASQTAGAQAAVSAQSPFNAQWNTNVTTPLYGGGSTNFSSPGAPSVNYPSQATAQAVADMFGGKLMTQRLDTIMGGAPSAPMYGIDFGAGDPVNAGQVAFWLQRGDSPAEIRNRIAAGVTPPLGAAVRPSNEDQTYWNEGFGNSAPSWITQNPWSRSTFGQASTTPGASATTPSTAPATPSMTTPSITTPSVSSPSGPNLAALMSLFGSGSNLTTLLGLLSNLGYFGQQRRPALSGTARNGALTRSYYYPQYEPVY